MAEIEDRLLDTFLQIQWMYRKYQLKSLQAFGPMGDPHRGQGRVLALLKLKPVISQKELGSILDIRSQSLGELLSKLEKSEYITRSPSREDRRVLMVHLTEKGRKAAEFRADDTDAKRVFDCLNDEEKAVLLSYFDRIIEQIQCMFRDFPTDGECEDMMGEGIRERGLDHMKKHLEEHIEELRKSRERGEKERRTQRSKSK